MAALGRSVAGDQQRRIVAQRVEIVGILIARRDRHHARRHHGAVAVHDEQLIAGIRQRIGDHAGQLQAVCGLAQHDQAAIRCEIASVLRGCERLARDG